MSHGPIFAYCSEAAKAVLHDKLVRSNTVIFLILIMAHKPGSGGQSHPRTQRPVCLGRTCQPHMHTGTRPITPTQSPPQATSLPSLQPTQPGPKTPLS